MPAIQTTWNDERLTLLISHFDAGLSCRQIAAEIGVSRNAVIGKLSRLNLARRTDAGPRAARRSTAGKPRAPKLGPRAQYQILAAIYQAPQPGIEDEAIDESHRCSLLELGAHNCRWPISTPGADDFCFCGNVQVEGLPYCPGHSRLAYRPRAPQRFAPG